MHERGSPYITLDCYETAHVAEALRRDIEQLKKLATVRGATLPEYAHLISEHEQLLTRFEKRFQRTRIALQSLMGAHHAG